MFFGLSFGMGGWPSRRGGPRLSGPCGSIMLCRLIAARGEAVGLGVILAIDVAHQLGHDVLVVPGRTERCPPSSSSVRGTARSRCSPSPARLRVRSARWKIDGSGWSNRIAPIRTVVAHVVFHRRVIAVPRRPRPSGECPIRGDMELAAPLDGQDGSDLAILEGCDRRLEIAAVGHAVGADRPAAGQFELLGRNSRRQSRAPDHRGVRRGRPGRAG